MPMVGRSESSKSRVRSSVEDWKSVVFVTVWLLWKHVSADSRSQKHLNAQAHSDGLVHVEDRDKEGRTSRDGHVEPMRESHLA